MSPFDATVVDNLGRAGMVTLGKLNCDEFAMGSSNENSAYGNVLNPGTRKRYRAARRRSSAAVAARIAPVARDRHGRLHPRTGGVHRHHRHQATYGRPSRWGMIAFASSSTPRAS